MIFAAVASWGFVAVAVVLAMWRVTTKQRIVVGPRTMLVPSGRWSNEEATIELATITTLSLRHVSGQDFLSIDHTGGTFTLNRAMLPRNADFAVIYEYLATGAWPDGAWGPAEVEAPTSPTAFQRSIPRATPGWFYLVLKIGALLTFCGGPLYLSDRLEPIVHQPWAFGVAFAPVAVFLFATLSLVEDGPRSGGIAVWSGAISSAVILVESAWAAWQIMAGPARADSGLMLLGCAVSFAVVVAYAQLASRSPASGARPRD